MRATYSIFSIINGMVERKDFENRKKRVHITLDNITPDMTTKKVDSILGVINLLYISDAELRKHLGNKWNNISEKEINEGFVSAIMYLNIPIIRHAWFNNEKDEIEFSQKGLIPQGEWICNKCKGINPETQKKCLGCNTIRYYWIKEYIDTSKNKETIELFNYYLQYGT